MQIHNYQILKQCKPFVKFNYMYCGEHKIKYNWSNIKNN